MARFCWRERTERVNWRMLKNLQLSEIVRRGDPTLLEPYTLHLTFAKLPVVVTSLRPSKHDIYEDLLEPGNQHREDNGGGGRNAWFLVRVFQLAMEYLLFLRARDGAVVDTLREELLTCEKDCELLMERAKKWKERAKSSDRQTDKLHHVLQGIAKLLQIEGATPSAVTTIEGLLRDLIVPHEGKRHAQRDTPQVEEARVCTLCGKMFSSLEFLEKHTLRRHAGQEPPRELRTEKKKPMSNTNEERGANEGQDAHASGVKAMLRQVEQTLYEHQATLRNVAQEEADKIHNLYEQLHVETQLADEMRAKRMAIESQVEQARQELDDLHHEKGDVMTEIREMKEQLQFLEMKRKIQAQNGVSSNATDPSDATLQLELKRLENTISVLKDALATSREELQRVQDSYALLLKEKQGLHVEPTPDVTEVRPMPVTKDTGCQTSVPLTSSSSQTSDLPQPPPPPTIVVDTRVEAGDAAVQTDPLVDHRPYVDESVQTDPVVVPVEEKPHSPSPVEPVRDSAVEQPMESGTTMPDLEVIFQSHCGAISDAVQQRALRMAHTKAVTQPQPSEKLYSSLPRRRFLRSRFLHDEVAVREQITVQVKKLEHISQRYGVHAKSAVLANEHVEVVQRALHAHLEVLPAEVLQRMIDVERQVNGLITSEWMPNEKSRQQALEVLTANRAAKTERNAVLIRQALGALGSTIPEDSVEVVSVPHDMERSSAAVLPVVEASLPATTPPALVHPSVVEAESSRTPQPDQTVSSTRENASIEISTLPERRGESQPIDSVQAEPRHVPNLYIHIESPHMDDIRREPHAISYLGGAPSPETVQEVRRHAIAVRSVKSISVSPPMSSPPKSSPPKSSPPKSSPPKSSPPKSSPPKSSSPKSSPPRSSSPRVDAPPPIPQGDDAEEKDSAVVVPAPIATELPRWQNRDRDEARPAAFERLSVVISDVASSELSLDTSIPSLGTDATSDAGFSVSQSFAKSSAEDLAVIEGDDDDDDDDVNEVRDSHDEIEEKSPESVGIDPVRDELSDSARSSPHQDSTEQAMSSEKRHGSSVSSPTNDIMAFDDSDIEEVMLN